MRKFEYTISFLKVYDGNAQDGSRYDRGEKYLNDMAENGWEVVTCAPDNHENIFLYTFRRPIKRRIRSLRKHGEQS